MLRKQQVDHQEKENCVDQCLTVRYMGLAADNSLLLPMVLPTIEMYAGILEELHIILSIVIIHAL